jgi:hypothetical protein
LTTSLPKLKLTEPFAKAPSEPTTYSTMGTLVAQMQDLTNRVEYIERRSPASPPGNRLLTYSYEPAEKYHTYTTAHEFFTRAIRPYEVFSYNLSTGMLERTSSIGTDSALLSTSMSSVSPSAEPFKDKLAPVAIGLYLPLCLTTSTLGFLLLQARDSQTLGLTLIAGNIATATLLFKVLLHKKESRR